MLSFNSVLEALVNEVKENKKTRGKKEWKRIKHHYSQTPTYLENTEEL